jgi:hypothetical protein
VRVDIHRRTNIRMTQQLLLDLEIYTQRMSQRGMAVPKRVPADATYPHFFCRRNKPVLSNSARPVRLSCIWICKYPVFVRWRSIPQLMLSQLLRQRRVEWHPSLRSRRFDSARFSVNVGWRMPIRIPSQSTSHHFRPSTSLTRSPIHISDNAHRSKRFGDVLQYLQELIYRENSWLPHSFRTVFYSH